MKQNIPQGSYSHIRSTYIPLMDGSSCACDNCGRLISNIVTVQHHDGKQYTIGADCAKNILSTNDLKDATDTIKRETRISKKIKELEQHGRPYVLNERGIPCFPPETRSGYYIPY